MEPSVLDRVKAFLPMLAQENQKLQDRIQSEGAEAVCLEDLTPVEHQPQVRISTGNASDTSDSNSESESEGELKEETSTCPVVSLDLGLGVFDLKTPQAVEAAEQACSQPGPATCSTSQSEAREGGGILESPGALLASLRGGANSGAGSPELGQGKRTRVALNAGTGVVGKAGEATGRRRGSQSSKVQVLASGASSRNDSTSSPSAGDAAGVVGAEGEKEEGVVGSKGVEVETPQGFLLRPVTTKRTGQGVSSTRGSD